jgi:hypothetical protein
MEPDRPRTRYDTQGSHYDNEYLEIGAGMRKGSLFVKSLLVLRAANCACEINYLGDSRPVSGSTTNYGAI